MTVLNSLVLAALVLVALGAAFVVLAIKQKRKGQMDNTPLARSPAPALATGDEGGLGRAVREGPGTGQPWDIDPLGTRRQPGDAGDRRAHPVGPAHRTL